MVRRTSLVLILSVLLLTTASAIYAEDGAALFKAKCAMCHGPDGNGDTTMGKKLALKPLSSADIQKKSDADLTTVVTNGKGKMPAFKKLTEGEVKAVLGFVRTFKK